MLEFLSAQLVASPVRGAMTHLLIKRVHF